MILGIIVACEIGFWVCIALGLTARYPLRRPRLGVVLLAMAPVLDLVLLVATVAHLRSGAQASLEHSLAAIYLGFSVAYGHRMIAWADRHYAHRFAGGPKPVGLTGAAYTSKCWGDVGRTALAAGIACGLTAGLIWMVGDPARTLALESTYRWMGLIFMIDLIWAIWTTFDPKQPKSGSEQEQVSAGV